MSTDPTTDTRRAYLVGGGIAALAAAVFLIRDGGLRGDRIEVLEESPLYGGALDGVGDAEHGYLIRGGRMWNTPAYTCTYDLLSGIPSLREPGTTVLEEIRDFNARVRTHAKARLVGSGARKLDVSSPGFGWRDRRDLLAMMARSEESLGTRRIDECFRPSFFRTPFWFMWCTTFAFQPWHSAVEFKRYLHRFTHEFPRIHTLAGVDRTPLNQYDSVVRPLIAWLAARGVTLRRGTRVVDLDLAHDGPHVAVQRIHYLRDGEAGTIVVRPGDLVFATIGSMTADATTGTSTTPAPLVTDRRDGAWRLWETIAGRDARFGRPATFIDRVDESKWPSFTATFHDPAFFRLMVAFSGNEPGTGALVTLRDSNWLMSVVLARQPHFAGQPDDVQVCWGYGLSPDRRGNFVDKPMSGCTGHEMLTELCRHLGFDAALPRILETTTVIPCMMPYITSQFLTRAPGDRPAVVPDGSRNLAFLGQFCEIPDDVVFTVEYSVRSARIAVDTLLARRAPVPPIYRGDRDPKVLAAATRTLLA